MRYYSIILPSNIIEVVVCVVSVCVVSVCVVSVCVVSVCVVSWLGFEDVEAEAAD